MPIWKERVERYLDGLAELVDAIDANLERIRVGTGSDDSAPLSGAAESLRLGLQGLEKKVFDREDLLRAPDAPEPGKTLAEKLAQLGELRLSGHCDSLGARIAEIHQRAISVFVCQYHLADFTTDLVRVLTGTAPPATYGGVGAEPPTASGGLFNEAA